MQSYKVVFVDDQPIFRHGLEHILKARKDIEVVGHASDGLQAIEVARELQPDILILDVSMPKMRGTEALKEIKIKRTLWE